MLAPNIVSSQYDEKKNPATPTLLLLVLLLLLHLLLLDSLLRAQSKHHILRKVSLVRPPNTLKLPSGRPQQHAAEMT